MTKKDILTRKISEHAECNTALDVATALNLQLYVSSPNGKTITGMLTGKRDEDIQGWVQNGTNYLLPADIHVIREASYESGLNCVAAWNEISQELILAFQVEEEMVSEYDWLAYGILDGFMPNGLKLSCHLLPSHFYYINAFIDDVLMVVRPNEVLTTGHFMGGTLADYAHVVLADMGYEVDSITLDSAGFAHTAQALSEYGYYDVRPDSMLHLHLQGHTSHIKVQGAYIPDETIRAVLRGREPAVMAQETIADLWERIRSDEASYAALPHNYELGIRHVMTELATPEGGVYV